MKIKPFNWVKPENPAWQGQLAARTPLGFFHIVVYQQGDNPGVCGLLEMPGGIPREAREDFDSQEELESWLYSHLEKVFTEMICKN